MKKIGLISDSHSQMDPSVVKALAEVDEIWHAGDVGDPRILNELPAQPRKRIVYGNIDGELLRNEWEEEAFFTLEGVKVLMIHIGGKPPRYAKGVKARIVALQPDLFVCGHSHICKVEFDHHLNCLYMNPGAIGNHGFHLVKTMLKFELAEGKIRNLNVVELGKRGKI